MCNFFFSTQKSLIYTKLDEYWLEYSNSMQVLNSSITPYNVLQYIISNRDK